MYFIWQCIQKYRGIDGIFHLPAHSPVTAVGRGGQGWDARRWQGFLHSDILCWFSQAAGREWDQTGSSQEATWHPYSMWVWQVVALPTMLQCPLHNRSFWHIKEGGCLWKNGDTLLPSSSSPWNLVVCFMFEVCFSLLHHTMLEGASGHLRNGLLMSSAQLSRSNSIYPAFAQISVYCMIFCCRAREGEAHGNKHKS